VEVKLRAKANGSLDRKWLDMSANLAMISDGKKFMWDGQSYPNKEEASAAEQSYRKENFEVEVVEQEGKFLVYTRRVVKVVAAS
jgi:hypothetical protein